MPRRGPPPSRGQPCSFPCGGKFQETPDPCGEGTLRWERPDQGTACYYCERTYNLRFAHKYRSRKTCVDAMMSKPVCDSFLNTRQEGIDRTNAGEHMFLPKAVADVVGVTTTTTTESQRVSLKPPSRQFLPWKLHVALFGKKVNKQAGHERKSIHGIDGVVLPPDHAPVPGAWTVEWAHDDVVSRNCTAAASTLDGDSGDEVDHASRAYADLIRERNDALDISKNFGAGTASSSMLPWQAAPPAPAPVPATRNRKRGQAALGLEEVVELGFQLTPPHSTHTLRSHPTPRRPTRPSDNHHGRHHNTHSDPSVPALRPHHPRCVAIVDPSCSSLSVSRRHWMGHRLSKMQPFLRRRSGAVLRLRPRGRRRRRTPHCQHLHRSRSPAPSSSLHRPQCRRTRHPAACPPPRQHWASSPKSHLPVPAPWPTSSCSASPHRVLLQPAVMGEPRAGLAAGRGRCHRWPRSIWTCSPQVTRPCSAHAETSLCAP